MKHTIAIVGGGACGVATFIELFIKIHQLGIGHKVRLDWFEKDETLGHGLAFGSEEKGHLLNTPTDLMGVYAKEPDHFTDWVADRKSNDSELVKGEGGWSDKYTARFLYGDYLQEQADEYLAMANRTGFEVCVKRTRICELDQDKSTYVLHDQSGGVHTADFVVLALGTPKPHNFLELREYENYVPFPWPSKPITDRLEGKKHVGVLGSSLSAIDTIMTLEDNGYKGKITLFSPDGLLPKVQPIENKGIDRKYLTVPNIHKIAREQLKRIRTVDLYHLFEKEFDHQTAGSQALSRFNRIGKDAAQCLDEDIGNAGNGGDMLMNIAYALRYDSSTIWNDMSRREKVKFMKHLGPHWATNRHAMPLPNAKRLQKLFHEGRLRVMPFFERVEKLDEGFKMHFQEDKNQDSQSVDLLINATGSPSQLSLMDDPLIQSMLEKKIVEEYPVGGALVNYRTLQVMAPQSGNGLFATGHLVNGILMDVNAVWFNVRTIETLVEELLFKLRHRDSI
ncbi:MAG: FAD/NAD(P)-binding protein [Cyclobacteriaceae bacterium]|nr:FAD/NAD(P)-binding protein [Cyclobacteriaceae bacterium]MCH8515981.1 FAD/NAD(P)-binding protein [Cyclobacteriaceae bacterium]